MFFFTRAFLCIGAVVVLAEGLSPGRLWDDSRETVSAAGRGASGQIESYCRAQPARCLAIAGAVAAGGLGHAPAAAPPVPPRAPHAKVHRRPGAAAARAKPPPDPRV